MLDGSITRDGRHRAGDVSSLDPGDPAMIGGIPKAGAAAVVAIRRSPGSV
jgi:hypothetical protein